MKHHIMELIGSFFLVLALAIGSPIAVGAMLVGLTYVGWHISGAHYNPAVTTAMAVHTRISREDILCYIGMQICGAFLGAAFWYFLTGQFFPLEKGSSDMLWKVVTFEIVMTFLFCLVFVAVYDLFRKKSVNEYGLAIGATISAIVWLQAIINPAVVIGALIFALVKGGSMAMFGPQLAYIIAPIIGGYLAARAYSYMSKGN
jgi:aquaporin Z